MKTKAHNLIAILLVTVSTTAYAQNVFFDWVGVMGSASNDEGRALTTDVQGNVYSTGDFYATVDFNTGPGTFNLTSNGQTDIYVQKLASDGSFEWAFNLGGVSGDVGHGITTDAAGNLYITGAFSGTVDFDPRSGVFNLTAVGNTDIFVLKIDASANLIWARSMGGTNTDTGYSIEVDGAGNVYTTGYFKETVDFDPGAGTFNLTGFGTTNEDIFVHKLDANGNFVWAKQVGGTGQDQGLDLDVDNAGNSVVTGYFTGSADFDPGAGTLTLTGNGMNDAFLLKLDPVGDLLWAKQMGGSSFEEGHGVALDGAGNVYSTGFFYGSVDFNTGLGSTFLTAAGSADVYVQKLDQNGNFAWAQRFGGANLDRGYGIDVTVTGGVHLIGSYQGTIDFDPGAGVSNGTSNGGSDIFISRFDANGNFEWARQFGSFTTIEIGRSVAIGPFQQVYSTGFYAGTTDFDPGAGVTSLGTNGGRDIFVHKFFQCDNTNATDVVSACDSYTWIDGNTYTSSNNTATHILTNAAGCDSIVTLDLTINNSSTSTDVVSACDSYTWIDGNTYTSSNNTATHTLTNAAGCDSVVTLDLTINYSNSGIDVVTACDSYTWIDGITYTSSNNTATRILTNAAGCDSVVTLDLTINYSTTSVDAVTACDSYTWINGITYTASNNTATHTVTNAVGCDSVITLNLTINSSTSSVDIVTACDSYTWIDGNTYVSSNNIATYTVTNAAGCDSTITLNLTLNTSTTSVDVVTACDSYTWIDGNTYTSSNNTATHTLTNAAGCDSVVTLDLTINNSSTGTDVITACDSYTWIDGNTYTASNTTATHILTNAAGCDSVVTLNLTINYSTTSVDAVTACDTYTWIDGNTYTSSNNTATHTVTNAVGCDSVITLNLIINASASTVDVVTACDSFTWIDGNTYTSSNNTATFLLTTVDGCDSLVTLDLTIASVDVSVTSNDPELIANATGASFQWIDCQNFSPISGATNASFTPGSNGDYAVIVTQGNCTDTSICHPVTTVGMYELESTLVEVQPNPARTQFTLLADEPIQSIALLDMSGRMVERFDPYSSVFRVEHIPTGTYFLHLVVGRIAIQKRLIIH